MTVVPPLVMSLYVNWSGLGYVLFEDPLVPFDWGWIEGRAKHGKRALLRAVQKLLERYAPVVVVLEDWRERDIPRKARIEAIYESIVKVCEVALVPVEFVRMHAVRQMFRAYGSMSKYEIAQTIAKHIPAFGEVPERKPWEPEPPRQTIFDAAALALTFFQLAKE
jgi:hypothetical protein